MSRYHALTLTLALVLTAVSLATAQQELLTNGGFEQLNDKGLPVGWTQYGGGVPESQWSVDSRAHGGKNAVRFVDTGPNERDNRYAIGLQQDVTVEPGRMYLASVWLKSLARNHDQALVLQLTFLGTDRNYARYMPAQVGGDWERFTVGGVAPEGATKVRLYLYTMHFWTSETLLDDASLIAVPGNAPGARSALWGHGENPFSETRTLNLETPLTRGGQPAAIIAAPAAPEWQALARDLSQGLKAKTGVELPVAAPDQVKSLLSSPQTIVALGNLNNNFVIERLYWNNYTRADSLWPGQGAFALRTVHQPFNFAEKTNVLTVEASDLEGAKAGVAELIKRLPTGPDCGLIEPLLYVSNARFLTPAQVAALPTLESDRDLWCRFHEAARAYRDSGDRAWAERARQAMLACVARYQANPSYRVTWPEETTSGGIGAMWDVMEEAPVWSDSDRVEALNALFACMVSLPAHVSYWGTFADNDTVLFNHSTFPLIGIYWIARYLDRYYPTASRSFREYLAQVDGAFRGQVKSWKPQCDADGYQTIVPRHTIEYTLSRNDYTYFATGQVKQLADFLTTVCDNRGTTPGFGDSGYSTGPGYELSGLPVALWYYKDGRYLWRLEELYNNKWENPYDPAVKPVVWQELVGLNVVRLAPEFYRWLTTKPAYDEVLQKPTVSLEQGFDKLSFRESLERNAPFLLLDGIARGKHLHFDGNAITRYSADNEDWLIDGDYLVRNTTDHTMISVLRDGRCDQLIPPLAALEAAADLDTVAFTRTTVTGYNGADWARNLLWLKGIGFVVVDEMTARQPGEYLFEGIFKTLQRGEQKLSNGRVFSTVRATDGGAGTQGLTAVTDPVSGVARAVRFGALTSRLEFPLALAAGQYAVTVYAQGKDGGSDSFYLTVDDQEPVAFHIPIDKLGPSSSAWTKDVPTPNITVPTAGRHRFRLALREGPGAIVTKIVVADSKGKDVATIEATNPPQLAPGEVKAAPSARFFIKNDGRAQVTTSDRINHINLKLRYLRERTGGRLQAGEGRTLQNLFYNDRSDRVKDYDLRPRDDTSGVLWRGGKPWAYFSTRPAGLRALFCTAERVALIGLRRMPDLQADKPISLEIAFADGAATVYATAPTKLALGGKTQELPIGKTRLNLRSWKQLAALRQSVVQDLARAALAKTPKPTTAQVGRTATAWPAQWTVPAVNTEDGPAVINRIVPADLNGDGVDELLIGRGATCVCLDAAGKTLWTATADDRVNDICVGDLNQNGKPEVVFGSDDENFYLLDAQGQQLSRTHVDTLLKVGTSSVRDPRVANVALADVDGDGAPDLIIGTRNGNLCRYDASLKRLWSRDTIEHGTFRMSLLDVNHDGKLDILASNRYGAVEIFDAKGTQLGSPYSELGDVVFGAADLNGDGEVEVVNGSSTGACTVSRVTGAPLFRFDNFGYGVSDVATADVNGDGKPEAIIASETGYVYVLDGTGKTLGQRLVGDALLSLAVTGSGDKTTVVVGTRDGRAVRLNDRLEVTGSYTAAGPVTRLAWARCAAGQTQLVLAGGEVLTSLRP